MAEAVGSAYKRDLGVQHKHGITYWSYWFGERTGKAFCLVETPSKEAAIAVHQEAHGLLIDGVIEVKEGT